MASRLEAATKQFGVEILISGPLYDIISDEFQEIMREIDTVTVKGSIQPIRLFTIDVIIEDMVKTSDPLLRKSHKEKKSIRAKERKMLFERLKQGQTTWKELRSDNEFVELRRNHDPDFEELFERAYRAYLMGDWVIASKGVK